MELVKNKLRICHYAQVPCEPYIVENIKDEYEAAKIADILAYQHLFLREKRIIPDYSNVITIEMFDEEEQEWVDYWNDKEYMDWEELYNTYIH